MKIDRHKCFICNSPLTEESTVCKKCTENEDAYDMYKMEFAKLMETV